MANRPPWTADYICTTHQRPGDDPEEAGCAAQLFVPSGSFTPYAPGATKPGPFTAAAGLAAAKFRKRPEPAEVTAVAVGDTMMVSTGQGPDFPMGRDQFFATYEAVEADSPPEEDGALAKAPPLPFDVAKTAMLPPGSQGTALAEPFKPVQTDDDAQADQAAGEASEEKTPTPPKKGKGR
jgi:hypothetical protein